MVPFRVFNKESKEWWVVLNYHPGAGNGTYLLAREDDEDHERDGVMTMIKAEELVKYRLVDFLEESDGYSE